MAMAISPMPRRWRLRTLMLVVALFAVGFGTYRFWVERGPVHWLIWQLRTGNAQARRKAAVQIGLFGSRALIAIETLKSALDDPDEYVRSNAMYSLVRLGWRSPRLLPILAERIESTPEPHPGFSPRSSDDIDPIRALELIRPDATAFVPLLGTALKSPDRWIRRAALKALFAIASWSDPSGPEPQGALLAVLADGRDDPHPAEPQGFNRFWDHKRATDALATLDPAAQERAVAQLAGDLRDLGSPRSYEAALLMPRLDGGKAKAVSILLDFIRDGDDTARRIAMILLQPIAEPAEARVVLRAITAPGADRKIDLRGRLGWWEWVGANLGYAGFRRFLQGTSRGETTLIEPGVRAIEEMGPQIERRAIDDLIAMVRQPGADPNRRCCAIIALGEFGPSAALAIPALEDAIRAHEAADRGASQRFAAPDSAGYLATQAVGLIAAEGNSDAIALLARLVADPRASVAPEASWMLFRLGPKARPAVPALVKGLKDPRQVVRANSAVALGKIGGPEVRAVLPDLKAALEDEDHAVRQFAAAAMEKIR
jgi:HEAT repeat protein